jgi:hypothetical protein
MLQDKSCGHRTVRSHGYSELNTTGLRFAQSFDASCLMSFAGSDKPWVFAILVKDTRAVWVGITCLQCYIETTLFTETSPKYAVTYAFIIL